MKKDRKPKLTYRPQVKPKLTYMPQDHLGRIRPKVTVKDDQDKQDRTHNVDVTPYGAAAHLINTNAAKFYIGPDWKDYLEVIFTKVKGKLVLNIRGGMGPIQIQPQASNTVYVSMQTQQEMIDEFKKEREDQ
jgi:hypothetical protein